MYDFFFHQVAYLFNAPLSCALEFCKVTPCLAHALGDMRTCSASSMANLRADASLVNFSHRLVETTPASYPNHNVNHTESFSK